MKKLITICLTTGFVYLLAGCSKSFVERNPFTEIPTDQALSTEAGLNDALTGVHARLRSSNLWGEYIPVVGDLRADNTFVETRNSGRFLTQYNYATTVSDDAAAAIWPTAYTAILGTNLILGSQATGTRVAAIKAQAYALRALLYFKLVNLFARPYTDSPDGLGVPLVVKYDPGNLPARSKVSEVYTQIISDLKAAVKDGPEYTSSVFMNKWAAEALLAKVYLYMGDNANAKATALDVIAKSGFTPVTPATFAGYWANPAARTDKVETLFEVDANEINNNGYDDLAGIYINGYQDIYASMQLYNLYSATDVRASVLLPGKTKSGATAILVNKFPNALNADRDNIKVIRLSEVYLIAAEASLPASEADARNYLNQLVKQRDPAFAGYTSTGAALLSDIVQERRKELAFEGDRLSDLNRLKLPIMRVANAGAIQAGQNNVNLQVPYADFRRILPIPQIETQVNPAIAKQQNPGY